MATTNLKYSTTQKFAEVIGIEKKIPSWDVGSSPTKENVGTGDNSQTIFYLDHQNIINNSQTVYYGSAETTTTTLTETTHYTIDLDKGKITLTSSGVTLVSTNKIYAEYSYFSNEMSDSYLTRVLERAEVEVDGRIDSTFTDGTATNPSYPSKTEIQPSVGFFNKQIIIENKPLIDISSSLNGNITSSQTTIDLSSGDGSKFPSSGYLVIGSEVISYTGITTDQLTGVTRGVLDSTASAHSDGDSVHSTIFFISNTTEGTAATFTVQPWDSYMYATERGLIYSFDEPTTVSTQYPTRMVNQDVASRVKIIYYYGYKTIPKDITRLTLLLAKRQLIQDNISKSMIAGRDEFNPEMFNADLMEINSIIKDYRIPKMGNT